MPVPPANIIDIASDADAGEWIAALPFVGFPVSDFEPVDHGVDRFADRNGLASASPFHDLNPSDEEAQDCADQ